MRTRDLSVLLAAGVLFGTVLAGCDAGAPQPAAPAEPPAGEVIEPRSIEPTDLPAPIATVVTDADQGLGVAAIDAALAASARPEADRARDAGRKPAESLAFIGIRPGDTALDVIAAGGWFTEVLAAVVGPEGKVYAQNPDVVLKMRDGANEKALGERLAGGRLPNVARLDREVADLGIEAGSVDVAVTAMNFHDVYNNGGHDAALGFSKAIFAALKPGGVFGVIDHAGAAGADNKALHRMLEADAVKVLEEAGFTVESSSVLANPADPHTAGVFDPSIVGQTDQFLLRATKPAQ